MEMKEILFFAVVVVFWIFSILSKKFVKNQNSAEKKGFTLRILEFIAELKEEGEKVQAPFAAQQVPLSIKKPKVIIPAAANKSAVLAVSKEPSYDVAACSKSMPRLLRRKGGPGKFHKQKMRDAIAWSEILGTPLGLRRP